jgi:hypothetical protein
MVQGEPSLGTATGQPGVVGGGLHCQWIGGTMHSPAHSAQRQMVLPYVQTSPLGMLGVQVVLVLGCELGQLVGVMQTLPGACHLPPTQSHSSRHSGRTELP